MSAAGRARAVRLRCRRSYLFLIPLFALALSLAASHAPAASGGQKWALLVGVNDYEDDSISDLIYAVPDVNAVAQTLKASAGFPASNVFVMTSDIGSGPDKPTDLNVIKRLSVLADRIGPDDTFVFYFSGHGYIRGEGRHFLGTVNADPFDADTLYKSSLPLETLRERMRRIKARQVVFIIDACRNDPEKGRGDAPNVRTAGFSRELVLTASAANRGQSGTAVLFACSEGERSYEEPVVQHGIFTYHLLRGLAGRAAEANGQVTVNGLADYVQRQVAEWATRNNKRQRPDLLQSGAARIVLAEPLAPREPVVRPAVPPEVPNRPPGNVQTKINPADRAEMVFVPAGEFLMGDDDQPDNPRHTVYLDGFWVYRNLVTVAQYRAFCQVTERKMPRTPAWGWKDDHPIVNVSWEDAKAYCQWAGVRLPTEAEWEKAARGTDGRKFPWGDDFDRSRLWSKSKISGAKSTAPAGAFPTGASPYGVLDMAGNVWQWCADWYGEDYTKTAPGRNPPGPAFGNRRVLRGGSWDNDDPLAFRAANRSGSLPTDRLAYGGFRGAAAAPDG